MVSRAQGVVDRDPVRSRELALPGAVGTPLKDVLGGSPPAAALNGSYPKWIGGVLLDASPDSRSLPGSWGAAATPMKKYVSASP